MNREPYPTDLTDAQWSLISPLVPAPEPGGRPAKYDRRDIVDAVPDLLRSGAAWRLLPHDFPDWRCVYQYFRRWRRDGTWERLHAALREKVRRAAGRDPQPSAGCLDSQSAKATEVGGPKGSDAGKRGQRSQAACAG